jgi:hypothetical protein
MTAFYQSRRLRYEIQIRREGRWRIDSVVEDGRDEQGRFDGRDFEDLEKNIIGRANSILAVKGNEAVRVMRERLRGDGFSTSKEIYQKEAARDRDTAIGVGRLEDAAPNCANLADLYGRPACRAMNVVLRGFFDKLVITPLELLHMPAYARKLSDNNTLLQGAIHQVAAAQTGAAETALKARVGRLQALVDAAERRARESQAERKLPVLEGADLNRLALRMEARFGAEQHRFWVNVALARSLQGTSSFFAKVVFLLPCLDRPLPDALRRLVDEWVAGCFESPSLVMDLLGQRENLALALTALADLADGRLANVSSEAAGLVQALGRGALPMTAECIWERVERELRRGRPLCRNDSTQEWATVLRLSDALVPRCPAERRKSVEEALNRRLQRLQEEDAA